MTPSMDDLRRAGAEAKLVPLQQQMDRAVADLRSTRRGRVAWWIARRITRGGRP